MIYIPIWLDLLLSLLAYLILLNHYLHSNMVRFIMKNHIQYYREYYKIYIPIWLDLLLIMLSCQSTNYYDLHSNMVRFIIINEKEYFIETLIFTFQYG